jgi:hypothetical protein
MTTIRLTMVTPFGDETTSEQEVSSFLTPEEHAMAMISGANLSGMTIKKVEYI